MRPRGDTAKDEPMLTRLKSAFLAAFPLGVAVAVGGTALVEGRNWIAPPAGRTPFLLNLVISGILGSIVFLTYFLLALAGFNVSREGNVNLPTWQAWVLIVIAAIVTVFGGYFYVRKTVP